MNLRNVSAILMQQDLTEEEKVLLATACDRPSASTLTALAKVMRRFGWRAELLDLLYWGKGVFPAHLPNTIILAEELICSGLLDEAWVILMENPKRVAVSDHALECLLRIALLRNYSFLAETIVGLIEARDLFTAVSRSLMESLRINGSRSAREEVLQHSMGIDLHREEFELLCDVGGDEDRWLEMCQAIIAFTGSKEEDVAKAPVIVEMDEKSMSNFYRDMLRLLDV